MAVVPTGVSESGFVKHDQPFKENIARQRIIITLAIAAVALVAVSAALAGTLTTTATVTGTAGIS